MSFVSEHVLAERARGDVRAGRGLADIMARAFDHLDEQMPHPLWEQFGAIDFDDDVRQAAEAVATIVDQQPPPADLSAVSLLLYEFSGPDRRPTSTSSVLELSGATTYPAEDWRFGSRTVMWFPDAYLPTPGLAGLASAAARADEADGGDAYRITTYDLAFAHALGCTADLLRGSAGSLLLGDRACLGVASGFHDGDAVLLGELTASGLDLSLFSWC